MSQAVGGSNAAVIQVSDRARGTPRTDRIGAVEEHYRERSAQLQPPSRIAVNGDEPTADEIA
jgi:hypothetical protein